MKHFNSHRCIFRSEESKCMWTSVIVETFQLSFSLHFFGKSFLFLFLFFVLSLFWYFSFHVVSKSYDKHSYFILFTYLWRRDQPSNQICQICSCWIVCYFNKKSIFRIKIIQKPWNINQRIVCNSRKIWKQRVFIGLHMLKDNNSMDTKYCTMSDCSTEY